MASIHTNRGIGRARKARAALGLPPDQPLPDVVATLEERAGVHVVVLDLGDEVAGAYLTRRDRPLLFVNGTQPTGRQRFTVAHEYAHHHLQHGSVVDDEAALGGRVGDPREVEANAFAAEFLVPRAAVERRFPVRPAPVTLETVVRVACAFGVSARMARIRLATCGVLADNALRDRLDRRIQEGEHLELIERLGLGEPDDAVAAAAAAGPPRIPPALRDSPLGRFVDGGLGIADVARHIGRPAADVDRALSACGVPSPGAG